MSAALIDRVTAERLLARGRPVVVLLSGGRDSTCLLDLAVRINGPGAVSALHLNYGLRASADADERHCAQLCGRLRVPLEVRRPRRPQTGNVQAWAREERYAAAAEIAAPRGADVAAGHTATDQVETILYRLAASPGRRALLGMPASGGRLVRPLLGLTREATAGYCLERHLAWREDASNDSEEYARARVRHGLVKALDAVHPAARANVLRTAELLREETALLDELVDAELAGRSSVGVERLRELHPALRRLVVIRLAEDAAGTNVAQAGERIGEILALGARGGRAELHVGGLVSAVIEQGQVRMVRIEPRGQHEPRG